MALAAPRMGGLFGGVIAAIVVAHRDAAALRALSVGLNESVRVAGAAATMILLVMCPLGIAMATWTRSQRRKLVDRMDAHPTATGAQLVASAWAIFAVVAATYFGLWAAQTAFASTRVRRLATVLIVGAVLLALMWVAAPAKRFIGNRMEGSLFAVLRACAVPTFLLATCVGVAAWPVMAQLALRPLLSAVAVLAATFIGSLIAVRLGSRPLKVMRVVTPPAVAGLLCLLLWAAFTPSSRALRLAVELSSTVSGSFVKALRRRRSLPMPADPSAEQSAVCSPEAPPPTAEGVGKVTAGSPDILVITVDAVRWDHTSFSGYERDTTPALKRLSAEAAIFERAYTPASSTRQTFRALLTGVRSSLVYPVRSSAHQWGVGLASAQVTWAEYLEAAGYETLAFSCNPDIFSRGAGAMDGFSEVDESGDAAREKNGYAADHLIDSIIARLSRARDNGPRFVWTHLHEPHQPYETGPDPVDFGPSEVDRYDASIHYVDGELARLVEFVRAPERRAHTWLFITADHGQAFKEHGKRYHGLTVYEEEVHVPLLVWGPGVAPRRIGGPMNILDLVPTSLDLAGLKPPAALCGRSLRGALEGGELDPRPVYIENVPDFTRTYFAVAFIEGNLKTVLKPQSGVHELYDLGEDPSERRDLSGERTQVLAQQLEKLRRFQREHGLNPVAYGL